MHDRYRRNQFFFFFWCVAMKPRAVRVDSVVGRLQPTKQILKLVDIRNSPGCCVMRVGG